jgi:cytoskeletal protein CcmA (bactofilin family)
MLGSKNDPAKSDLIQRPAPITNGNTNGFSEPHYSHANPVPAAIIGPKIRFKGELVGEEDLLIQGQIDGTIDLKDNNLTVGEQGKLKANVLAKTITVQGEVEGDIFAQERIAILASSNVRGNLVAERVMLEDGAKFRGSIDMDVEAHRDEFQKMSVGTPDNPQEGFNRNKSVANKLLGAALEKSSEEPV